MAYNRVNKLRMYMRIVELTEKHFDPGATTYKGVWRKYVYPVYPVSYQQYMKIISTPNLDGLLEEEERRHAPWDDPMQLKLDF